MKKQILSFLGVLGVLMLAASAFAQSINLAADIPFDFTIDKGTLPAGHYEIRALDGGHALEINNRKAKVGRMFLTNDVSQPVGHSDKSELVFKRYGDQYFLSQIWVANSTTGRAFPPNARQKELARGNAPAKAVVMAESR